MTLLKYLPRFQRAYRELGTLAAREAWTRSEVASYQLARVNRIWQHAIAHVPYYETLAADHRLPASFASLDEFSARVPVLTRSVVQNARHRLLSRRHGRGQWNVTGGSTGQPAHVFCSTQARLEQLRARYRYLSAWGLDMLDRTVYLWGHAASFPHGLSGQLAKFSQPLTDRLRSRLRLSAYELTRSRLRDYLRQIERFRPTSIYGYSTAVSLLAREAESVGFSCDAIKLVVLTSEGASANAIRTIERAFRAPVSMEYGSMECGFIAGQMPGGGLQIREDIVRLETQARPDGRHDILVSVLTNAAFPLLRYAIGDTTTAPVEAGERGFGRLRDIAGRSNDVLVTGKGRYLHPTPLESLFEGVTVIRRYAVRQEEDGSVSVQLELEDASRPLNTARLRRQLEDALEGYPVSVECVTTLPLTAAGKHRWISSKRIVLLHGPTPATPGSEDRYAS